MVGNGKTGKWGSGSPLRASACKYKSQVEGKNEDVSLHYQTNLAGLLPGTGEARPKKNA